jgi:phage FluMu protein Com
MIKREEAVWRSYAMKCPNCGKQLNKAEQLWTLTHGRKQCPNCWAAVRLAARPGHEHLHSSKVKKGQKGRRGDRRLAA